jgi:hypothetical protein
MTCATRGRGVVAISNRPTIPQRRLTADYHSLVARAVASLETDSEEARADIYERARRTLSKHLTTMDPPFSGAEIAAELWALDEAIAQIEAPAADEPQAQARPNVAPKPPQAPKPAVASKPAVAPKPSPADRKSAARNPVRRAFVPVLLATAVVWAVVIYGPLKDPNTPPLGNVFGVVLWAILSTLLISSIIAVWYRRKRCREAGLVSRREPAFARRGFSAEARRKVAGGLDDQALFWAYFLPEHQVDAKLIVREELQRRGYSQADLDSWAPAPADVTVPHTLERPTSIERYRRLVRHRMWLFNGYLVVLTLLTAFLALSIYMMIAARKVGDLKEVIGVIGLLMFALAGLASLPFRNRTLRVLLLRPFGERKMTRALKHFVRKNPGRVGNVFTLSDRNYKPNLLITILWRLPAEGLDLLFIFLIGPLMGHSKRIASVKREGKFRKLERHLLRQYSPAFWSFMSGNQGFNIRSSDPWWQMCIHMLMHSCEIIVVDLSKVKAGTAWELEQLHRKAILDKCIFVVGEEHIADVGDVLERYFSPDEQPTVYVYSNAGKLIKAHDYDARFGQIMEAGLAG